MKLPIDELSDLRSHAASWKCNRYSEVLACDPAGDASNISSIAGEGPLRHHATSSQTLRSTFSVTSLNHLTFWDLLSLLPLQDALPRCTSSLTKSWASILAGSWTRRQAQDLVGMDQQQSFVYVHPSRHTHWIGKSRCCRPDARVPELEWTLRRLARLWRACN